jgi:hypothetical protein
VVSIEEGLLLPGHQTSKSTHLDDASAYATQAKKALLYGKKARVWQVLKNLQNGLLSLHPKTAILGIIEQRSSSLLRLTEDESRCFMLIQKVDEILEFLRLVIPWTMPDDESVLF